jgi:hypothetical protein
MAMALGWCQSSARAADASSVYTSLDLKKCKDVSPKDIEDRP